MRTNRNFLIALIAIAGSAHGVATQSLGDIARREAERRNQVEAGRTYTNEDLAAVDPAQAPAVAPARSEEPAAPAPATKPSGVTVREDPANGTVNINAPEAEKNRDEGYWRKRAKNARDRLATVNANIAAAQRRLTELESAPQTPATVRERELAAAALAQLQADAKLRNDDIAQMRTFAESQKVPAAWLE
jgi:hypothetical protein